MKIQKQNKLVEKKCFFCITKQSYHVASILDAPMILGCTLDNKNNDSLISYNVYSCKNCKLTFTDAILDEVGYSSVHSEAVGETWSDHHQSFKKFVNSTKMDKILEIGPSINPISRNNTEFIDFFERCPFNLHESEIYHKGRFPDFHLPKKFSKIIASHVFEHAENPELFLKKCKDLLNTDGTIFISIPNFELWINNKYWNGITPEHQIYPTIEQITQLCDRLNLNVIYEKFKDHSIFFKIQFGSIQKNLTIKTKLKVEEWFDSIIHSIKHIENIIIETNPDQIYLVGASHISQYPLLMSKIIEKKTKYVLDNSTSKHEKRIYGTNCICKPFDFIKNIHNPFIVIFNSPYIEEMKKQLISINKNSQIIYSEV